MDHPTYNRPVMKLDAFEIGLLERDRIPGLLLRSDENGYYQIGVQINEDEVVHVADALEDDLIFKMNYWAHKIEDIQRWYE